MSKKQLVALGVAALLLGLAGCGNEPEITDRDIRPNSLDNDDARGTDGSTIGDLFDSSNLSSEDGSVGSLGINKYLWRASLDTLSFLPLSSTDPFTGVIATDWGAADGAAERFKVTAYVSDTALEAKSLRVAVFRQVRGASGDWVAASVSPDTPRRIEDSILTRARQLKIDDL